MTEIIPPNAGQQIADTGLKMLQVFRTWTQIITRRVNQIVPAGGSSGQVLLKASNDDYDTVWGNSGGGGGSGSDGVLDGGSRLTGSSFISGGRRV